MEKVVKLNRGYQDLQVWQKSIDLAQAVYHVTSDFPKQEAYGLTSQMQRAAVSIASNIAEGSSRGAKEFSRFISISLGSAAELKTQLIIAIRIQYSNQEKLEQLLDQTSEIERMLHGLRRGL